jgi:hypothetical protein
LSSLPRHSSSWVQSVVKALSIIALRNTHVPTVAIHLSSMCSTSPSITQQSHDRWLQQSPMVYYLPQSTARLVLCSRRTHSINTLRTLVSAAGNVQFRASYRTSINHQTTNSRPVLRTAIMHAVAAVRRLCLHVRSILGSWCRHVTIIVPAVTCSKVVPGPIRASVPALVDDPS